MMNFSLGSTVSLHGVAPLYEHRFVFLLVLLLLYVFLMLSDGLVVYIICSQRSLHRPMYVLVVVMLVNSAMGSTAIYPKLLWDLVQGRRVALLSRSACLCQAFVVGSIGISSFIILLAMAFDRYLCICHPLHYTTLMSPTALTSLVLVCWLWPALIMAGTIVIASRLQVCRNSAARLLCDPYTVISMSCERGRILSEVYGLLSAIINVFLPIALVLLSYGRIFVLCLQRSRRFASKTLNTCLPHMIVFTNNCGCVISEMLHSRALSGTTLGNTIPTLVYLIIPTVCNPIVYGLKFGDIYRNLKKLLHCQKWHRRAGAEPREIRD